MAGDAVPPPGAVDEEVKPYKIHIPSKHLELTRQKLELTRLPHEGAEPQIEPLIDYWLESYSFRDTETKLNTNIPQFRTSLPVSSSSSASSSSSPESIRIHFIHSPSSSPSGGPSATPLLLLPPFPLTNLSLYPHITSSSLTSEFNTVIPAYPGTGFSDSLPSSSTSVLESTAHLFNTLMTQRLGYKTYLVSVTSPNSVDNILAQHLVSFYPESCVGANLINPALEKPKLAKDPWEWSKYLVARFFRGGLAGYSEEDFEQQQQQSVRQKGGDEEKGGDGVELQEPDTISYALCDSPVGTLAAVVKGLKSKNIGEAQGKKFSEEELVTLTNLAWLPGPEGAVRFAVAVGQEKKLSTPTKEKKNKRRVSVTVFTGGAGKKYCPPAWANTEYTLANTQRVKGSSPGLLLAFERPEVILEGVRGLVKGSEKLDTRAAKKEKKKMQGDTETAPFEGVLIHPATEEQEVTTPQDKLIQPPALEMSAISSPASGETAVAGMVDVRGKGKANTTAGDYLEPPAPIRFVSSDGESPDTLVENSPPPLDRA
ncbi:putative epoxide hydrolase [Cladorrhinum sp. PSN259]|nr:putative epoxide hydrolase [Cladorrhinum sp. PSN259]